MKLVTFHSRDPRELVAIDEVLLQKAEEGGIGETLRFWEPEDIFVVMGRAKHVDKDCFADQCRKDEIDIIRRISGGGTVLQGKGCLNYSVILSYDSDADYRNVRGSYSAILNKISGYFLEREIKVECLPLSDLAIGGKKVSGNAQARKRRYFLHHGTFLHDFDLNKIPMYLKYPEQEPEYRKGRTHRDFMTNLPVDAECVKNVVLKAFFPEEGGWEPGDEDLSELQKLVLNKYSKDSWNFAF